MLEETPVRLEHLGRLPVQRILRVGFLVNKKKKDSLLIQHYKALKKETHQKQILQPVHDRVDRQHRLPVLAQDVQTHVALEVDVRVVHLRFALDLGRLVRVVGTDLIIFFLLLHFNAQLTENSVQEPNVIFYSCTTVKNSLKTIWI